MKDLWKIAFGVLCGLLAGGLILLVSRGPRGQPVTLIPPPSPAPLAVHVAGAVAQPGVYNLPPGSRAQDAIQAAGGLTWNADPGALNLAAFLEDGSQLIVPIQASPTAPAAPTPLPPTQTPALPTPSPTPAFPIDLNTASQAELESLPWIGPVRAAEIIAYRQRAGLFTKIEDLLKVYGITPEVFESIRNLITVSSPP